MARLKLEQEHRALVSTHDRLKAAHTQLEESSARLNAERVENVVRVCACGCAGLNFDRRVARRKSRS
jgi:hypothetical protein